MFDWLKSRARRHSSELLLERAACRVVERLRFPLIERMEPRRLLQGCTVAGSAMTVSGNTTGDSINISIDVNSKLLVTNNGLEINHANCYVLASSITSITVNADDGSDTVSIDSAVSINATINGGNGGDQLTGGSGGGYA